MALSPSCENLQFHERNYIIFIFVRTGKGNNSTEKELKHVPCVFIAWWKTEANVRENLRADQWKPAGDAVEKMRKFYGKRTKTCSLCLHSLVKTLAKFVRILEQVKTHDCPEFSLIWSWILPQTFASVFTRLWRHGKHVFFVK